jgi:hypothetical protein
VGAILCGPEWCLPSVCHPGTCVQMDLMLLMGFTLPITNDEGPENILDSATDSDLGTVADKLGGCTMTSNHIL